MRLSRALNAEMEHADTIVSGSAFHGSMTLEWKAYLLVSRRVYGLYRANG